MGGRIDLLIDPMFAVMPYVQGGKMKMIATLGEKRVHGFEQFPTVGETVPGFSVGAMLG
jgi:tripartite-type tricarboxylate transporter receptor subunit TctC